MKQTYLYMLNIVLYSIVGTHTQTQTRKIKTARKCNLCTYIDVMWKTTSPSMLCLHDLAKFMLVSSGSRSFARHHSAADS